MKIFKSLLAAAALVVSVGASAGAQVTASLISGIPVGPFLALSGPAACTALTPCTLGPGVASIIGGTVFNSDMVQNDILFTGVNYLSAGMNATAPATLTFAPGGVAAVSFAWGSPDLFNLLTVNYLTGMVGGSRQFTVGGGPTGLNFGTTNGDQNVNQFVNFQAATGTQITSLVFNNAPADNAFEVGNFQVSAVPEPSSYALMAAGLAALGLVATRRKRA